MNPKIKVSIVGATGYTGVELLRLLANHPQVEVVNVTSRQDEGCLISEIFPSLRPFYGLRFTNPNDDELGQSDVVFFATPHTVAMSQVAKLLQRGTRVIDLSADFRLKDIAIWEEWYKVKHQATAYVDRAIYGLVELNREKIKTAQLVAVPGCYVTCVTLGLLPVLEHALLDQEANIIADCKSGVSGAGKSAKISNLFCEASDSMKAYALQGHRHYPEIQQNIALFDRDIAKKLIFVPHLIPMIRGMQATIYIKLRDNSIDLHEVFKDYYKNEKFIEVLPQGSVPETRNVRGSNICQLAVYRMYQSDCYAILSTIDNLMKGASGQAVQNMNVMFGLKESLGLNLVPLVP
ncbi:MAG: N-acetyl-gamma-glutamyl-phosphate reductase [Neisseriaceae bacterium]|nr:MAG: N-acetyl-gamma-glutamyl-phosphate reductase [Neisseriaceae bacterium]